MKEMEIYDSGRFFVMTGNHINGTPADIEERQNELNVIYARATTRQGSGTKEKRLRTSTKQIEALADEEVISLLGNAQNSNKFNRLYYEEICRSKVMIGVERLKRYVT